MAATSISVDQDQFCCSVCLDVLRDPVTIPCGHSYCMDCIKGYWNNDEHKGVYSCPQCRRTFSPRPVLARNTMLMDIVEKVKKTGFQNDPPGHFYAGPGDVKCDVCTRRKRKAVKSCLLCLASYCESHLTVHHELNREKTHKLVEPTKLQKIICSRHNKLLEVYCRTDQKCICHMCTTDGHKGHNIVSAAAERIKKQKQLDEAWRRSKQKTREREKELSRVVKYLKHSAQAAEEDSERIFTKLIRSIERRRSEVKELIRDQEKAALSQAEGLLERLEQQMAEHRKTETELELRSHTEDHIHFLQRCKSLCVPPEFGDLLSIDVHPYFSLIIVKRTLTELRDRLDEVCSRELTRISDMIKEEQHSQDEPSPCTSKQAEMAKEEMPISEPRTRAEFLQYCCELTLDPNTANAFLHLSEGNTEVKTGGELLPYPDHPERFDSWAQVLCREGLSGRCYWEADWGGRGAVSIGVSYRTIGRNGGSTDCKLGHNPKSWSLDCSDAICSFQHSQSSTEIPAPCSSRVGVYLDHRAGTLAFYGVSDTMTLLHRVQTTFTQPLYPGFWVGLGSTLKLCPVFSFSA